MKHKNNIIGKKVYITAFILFLVLFVQGCTSKHIKALRETSIAMCDNLIINAVDNCTLDQTRDYYKNACRNIYSAWEYPYVAARDGLDGEAHINFIIERDGNVKIINILNSSGYKVLDDGIIRAVKKASPFGALPACVDNTIVFQGKFKYVHLGLKKQ